MVGQPIEVWIDEDIAELIPGYLERRKEDIAHLADAIQHNDFQSIQHIGHSMKGSGGGYGLPEVSDIGRQLEASAALMDVEKIHISRNQLQHYVDHLVVYIKPCER